MLKKPAYTPGFASAVITMIIVAACLLNCAFATEGIPGQLAQWVTGLQLTSCSFCG